MIDTASSLGVHSLLNMVMSLLFIAISWWALQSFKFDLFVRDVHGPQAKLLQILLAIAIGHLVTLFFVHYIQWTQMLRLFF